MTLRRALTSESFVEKAALLLLTAILSGLVVPVVIGSLQAKRARRDAIVQAQAKLLDDMSETILTYETLLLDVSWFATNLARNDEMHQKAFAKYSDRAVDLVAKWRAQAARAQSLASPAISAKLDAFLLKVFRAQDTPMNLLYRRGGEAEAWDKLHEVNAGMLKEANDLIGEIARDLKISKTDF